MNERRRVMCGGEKEPVDYSLQYLTITSLEDSNTIYWKTSNNKLTKTISVSTDNGETWSDKTSSTSSGTTLATLSKGQKILVKGSNTEYSNGSYYNYFGFSKETNVSGNIMSLCHGDDFVGQTTASDYAFNSLFRSCNKLKNAKNLILPATTLASRCYESMFERCSSLVKAPSLPATTLASYCYQSMFYYCTSLTTAPELPATTLQPSCYSTMFRNCRLLTTAPVLPATTLVNGCYDGMFLGCESLNYIKAMFTTAPSSSYTSNWVFYVASTGTFVKNALAPWNNRGENAIPLGWTVKTASE